MSYDAPVASSGLLMAARAAGGGISARLAADVADRDPAADGSDVRIGRAADPRSRSAQWRGVGHDRAARHRLWLCRRGVHHSVAVQSQLSPSEAARRGLYPGAWDWPA